MNKKKNKDLLPSVQTMETGPWEREEEKGNQKNQVKIIALITGIVVLLLIVFFTLAKRPPSPHSSLERNKEKPTLSPTPTPPLSRAQKLIKEIEQEEKKLEEINPFGQELNFPPLDLKM